MENENITPEQENTVQNTPSPLNTVTPLSKYLAMALFTVLPFIGGWIGYTYAPEKVVEVIKHETTPTDMDIAEKNTEPETIELQKITSPSGNTLTLVRQNNNEAKYPSCDNFFIKNKKLRDYFNEWLAEELRREGCQVNIDSASTTLTYRAEKLDTLGGYPLYWINDTQIMSRSVVATGVGGPSFRVYGIFNTKDESFTEIAELESAGGRNNSLFMSFEGKRFMLAREYNAEAQSASYTLYDLTNSTDDFYDFFLPNNSSNTQLGKTSNEIDPNKISELETISAFEILAADKLNSDITNMDVNVDGILTLEFPENVYEFDFNTEKFEKKSGR